MLPWFPGWMCAARSGCWHRGADRCRARAQPVPVLVCAPAPPSDGVDNRASTFGNISTDAVVLATPNGRALLVTLNALVVKACL